MNATRHRFVPILLMLALCVPLLMALPETAAAAAPTPPSSVVNPQITTDTLDRTAKLTWGAPTQYTDGTPITEPITYNIYEGNCSLSTLPKVLSGLTALTVNRTTTGPGIVCYQVSAQVPNGGESALSQRASKTFPWPKPNTVPTLSVE